MSYNAVTAAIQIAGGVTHLARKLGLSYQAVRKWEAGRVPAERCRAIEIATNGQVTRHELRPDIFGPAPERVPVFLPDRRKGDDARYAGPERRNGQPPASSALSTTGE